MSKPTSTKEIEITIPEGYNHMAGEELCIKCQSFNVFARYSYKIGFNLICKDCGYRWNR